MSTRPLFDPEKVRGPERDAIVPATGDSALSVSELATLVEHALTRHLPARVRVMGEISGFSDRTHWYFRLKDEQAILDCVMFSAAAKRTGFAPANGQKVILSGRIEFYARQGRTQFYAESMELFGAGALEAKFRQLCDELRALGWFAPERKRPLPHHPARIAIVTSRTGAALQDVLVTMRKRCASVEIVLVDARVQGDGAAEQVASAIDRLSSRHERLGIDAVLVTRGGGSLEDLWAFNERRVAESILRCAVPVVAAIGHETDVTIAELVADHRAATPTQAAMLMTPDSESLMEELAQLESRLSSARRRRVEREHDRAAHLAGRLLHSAHLRLGREQVRIERSAERLAHLRPEAVYAARRVAVGELGQRLRHAFECRLRDTNLATLGADLARAWALAFGRRADRLDSLERELIVTGPLSVLNRGYSVTTDSGGRVVRSALQIKPGATVHTRVADGTFRSVTQGTEPAGEAAPDSPTLPPRTSLPPPPPRKRRGAGAGRDQMDLF